MSVVGNPYLLCSEGRNLKRVSTFGMGELHNQLLRIVQQLQLVSMSSAGFCMFQSGELNEAPMVLALAISSSFEPDVMALSSLIPNAAMDGLALYSTRRWIH